MDAGFRSGLAQRATLFAATVAVVVLGLTVRADALVYWGNGGPHTIGRADLDGTHATQDFITGRVNIRGVAVDDSHVYWTNWGQVNPSASSIGRANLDGTGVDQDFITGSDTHGVAVDASHIYWTDYDLERIGRADLDGTNVEPAIVTGVPSGAGIAVDASHIYWADGDSIGRADLDGTPSDPNFISGVEAGDGIAVDSTHIYWTRPGTSGSDPNRIDRANIDGTGVDEEFIVLAGDDPPVTGVAVDGGAIYWAGSSGSESNLIGRANLDGTGVNETFLTGTGQTYSVAADALRYPTAAAGPDQTVARGAAVTLNGAGSSDPNGGPLTYSWTQTAGSGVTLSGAGTALAGFTAPSDPATLGFQLEVCDSSALCDAATTKVNVDPPPKIKGLEVSPNSFAAGSQKTPLHGKTGTKIKLKLSEDAKVRFRIRRDPPRKAGDSAPNQPRVFKRKLDQGRNSVEFTGTLGKRTFGPGAYRLIARARDSLGQASKRVRTGFEITG